MNNNKAITGLMVYAFYSASGNIMIMLGVVMLISVFAAVTGNPGLIGGVVGAGVAVLPNITLLNAHKDSTSKWTKFRAAMPVKRRSIVASLYISHVLTCIVAIALMAALLAVFWGLHGDFMAELNFPALVPLAVVFPLLACALFYPLLFTIGEGKEEALSIICILGGAAAAVGIFWFAIYWGQGLWEHWQASIKLGAIFGYADGLGVFLYFVISLVLFVLSYVISVKIYAKKDL